MADVIFVAVVVAFFATAVAYVRGCARIVGDEEIVRAGDRADMSEPNISEAA